MSDLEDLKIRLKTGEYDGVDIMSARFAIEELIEIKALLKWSHSQHIQVAQYHTWFGTYQNERPDGEDGCISYEQTFINALRQAHNNLETNQP